MIKQTIKQVGEVKLDEVELKNVAFFYIKEDRKLIYLAVQKYLRSLHKFELKSLVLESDPRKGGGMMVKCEVESGKGLSTNKSFISKPLTAQSLAARTLTSDMMGTSTSNKLNHGFYATLMRVLEEGKKKSSKPMDAVKVFEEMKFELPNLVWRNFTIYVSDKRRQDKIGFRYDSKKKLMRTAIPKKEAA
jgi:hypothetical protein